MRKIKLVKFKKKLRLYTFCPLSIFVNPLSNTMEILKFVGQLFFLDNANVSAENICLWNSFLVIFSWLISKTTSDWHILLQNVTSNRLYQILQLGRHNYQVFPLISMLLIKNLISKHQSTSSISNVFIVFVEDRMGSTQDTSNCLTKFFTFSYLLFTVDLLTKISYI